MRIVLSIYLIWFALIANAQIQSLEYLGLANGSRFVRYNDPSMIGSKSTAQLEYSDVRGSCFWNNSWSPAFLVLKGEKQVKMQKVKLNLFTNEVYYVDLNGKELIALEGVIKKVIFIDSDDSTKVDAVFQNFASFQTKKTQNFVQVLNEGRVQMLKMTSVALTKSEYNPTLGKSDSRFSSTYSYFIKQDNEVSQLKKFGQTSLFEILHPDDAAKTWLVDNKNKLKSEGEILTYIAFLNQPR